MSAYFQDRRIVAASLAVGAVAALLVTPLYPSLRAHVNTLLLQLGITTTRKEEPYDAQLTFEQFLERQAELSWEHLRANIHPKGTAPGCIVASPSKNKPDYWYQMSPFYSLSLCICANQRIRPYWTRDSALVMRAVFQRWQQSKPASEEEKDLLAVLIDFVDATVDMQHRDTPSGGFKDGGLGEGTVLSFRFNQLIPPGSSKVDSQVSCRPKSIHWSVGPSSTRTLAYAMDLRRSL